MIAHLTEYFRRLMSCPGSVFSRKEDGPSGVFSINLIRSRSFFRLDRRWLSFAVLAYLVVQGLILLFLLLRGIGFEVEMVRFQRDFQRAFPTIASPAEVKEKLDQLSQRAQASLAELKNALAVEQGKFQIAGKLAGIVRTVPVRTWVSSIRWDASARTMVIEASYLVDMRDAYYLPFKSWMDALRQDPGFGPGLKKLEQGRSTQTKAGQATVCLFEIMAGW